MKRRKDPFVNINPVDSGSRLKELRELRINKFRKEFINQGLTDPKELRQQLKIQEEKDFHEMGYSNRRYMKEMLLGNRIITDDVLKFYSEKCDVPENWILYGTFDEYVQLVLNPVKNTVSKKNCLKIAIEARKKEITYGQAWKIIEVAQSLKIIPVIGGFTNIIDIYDNKPNGKGLLLLYFYNYKEAVTKTAFQPILNQMMRSASSKQKLTYTVEDYYFEFIHTVVRKEDKEYQNPLSIMGLSQELILDIENELPDTDEFTSAEKRKIIPKYHKMATKLREERQIVISALKEQLGDNVESEENYPYYREWMKFFTLLEPIQGSEFNQKIRAKVDEQISKEKVDFALDFRNIVSFDKHKKEQAIEIFDEINQILEKESNQYKK